MRQRLMRHAVVVKLFQGAVMVAGAIALSSCGSGDVLGGTACPASLQGTGVGISYSGFAAGTKLSVKVCAARTCHESVLATTKGSETWIGAGIYPQVMKGVQTISVSVRDSSDHIVASNQAVRVRRLQVVKGCTTTIYDAAVQVSPGRVATATT